MKTILFITFGVFLAILTFFIILWAETANVNLVAPTTSAITVLSTYFTILYIRYESFFLFINRIILRFSRVHTKWEFYAQYNPPFDRSVTIAQCEKYLNQALLKAFPFYNVVISNSLANKITLRVDNRFEAWLRVNDQIVEFGTSRILVPNHLYNRYIESFRTLFSTLQDHLRSDSALYRANIIFEEKNPYFGFFLRYIPPQLVKFFRCTFSAPDYQQSQIEATADALTFDTKEWNELLTLTSKYLALSTSLYQRNTR